MSTRPIVMLALLAIAAGMVAADQRFVRTGRTLDGPAEWLSVHGHRMVHGSGSTLQVAC